ncbi:hypothetical protein UFOVP681_26 [uncultured Caudovirales phage]|uniref:HD domain-containing protein n=1 Tax=uncultured Caudovirales phage TaxID=2100421 RepID=A0A6J5NKU0_9CAUD|nr:hypothetical protein UFOVP681_26 [uncultured Caudovirales phage]
MTPGTIFRIWQANVRRWHHSTDHRLRESNDCIQAHQARVAQLVALIFPDCTKDDLLEALFHDVPESWTGDVSYTAKHVPIIKDAHAFAEADTALRLGLPSTCSDRVKLCDGIDAILWAASRVSDTLAGNGWPYHIQQVKGLAWRLGVGPAVEGIFSKAGIR